MAKAVSIFDKRARPYQDGILINSNHSTLNTKEMLGRVSERPSGSRVRISRQFRIQHYNEPREPERKARSHLHIVENSKARNIEGRFGIETPRFTYLNIFNIKS